MGRSSIFVLRAILVALVLTGSSALAIWTAGSSPPSPSLPPDAGSLPTASTAGAASPPSSIIPAASSWGAQTAADQARSGTIASDLESHGVRADLIHLPSTEPVGFIEGKLVPGPEYALDKSDSGISQGYSVPPAPAGIAYYGESGNDSGPEEQTTSLDTSSLAGTLNVQNLTTLYLDSDNPDQYGVQLNAVLVNLSLQGGTNNEGIPYDLWVQNVMSYQGLNRTLSFVENTWNFSSSDPDFPSGLSTVVASDLSDSNDYGVYVGQGPYLNAPPPFNLTLYLNTSLINPFVCTPESTVYLSSDCSNTTKGTADYAGDQTLFYNYTFYDDKTHYFTSGTYDWLTFHTGKGSVLDKSNKRLAGFEASGNVPNPEGLPSDWELDVGVGAFDGANQNVFNGSGTATLDYLSDCTHPAAGAPSNCHPPANPAFKPVPSALNFGSETGECSYGISVDYSKTTALFSAGPLDLHPLWGYAQQSGVASGATAVSNDVTVSGSPLALSTQPYIFIFLKDLSIDSPLAEFAWAPDVPTWHLLPGKYAWEAMLADYTEKTGTLTVGTSPKTLTTVLPYHHAAGVYTPLWAVDNGQLAGISSSGAGTLSKPYALFNNPAPAAGGQLNDNFTSYDDYYFPTFAGILLWGTTEYVNLHAEVPFFVGYDYGSGMYLQQELYQTQNVSITNAADILGWPLMPTLSAYPAADNPVPVADLMIWDSSHDLVYRDTFVGTYCPIEGYYGFYASPDQLLFYGGSTNVVWGSTFTDPSGSTLATPGYYAGIAEAESGDLIYNNNFSIDNPAPMMFDPYTTDPPLTSYSDAWNISEQAASQAADTVNGFKLSGNILGPNEPFQGGNVWWNYGNALNPATRTPFTNVVDNPFYGEGPGISTGGDHLPLPGFNLTFTESELPKGTTWKVTVLGVGLSSNSTMITFLGAPDKNYSYTIGPVPGYMTTDSGNVKVDGGSVDVKVVFKTSSDRASSAVGPPMRSAGLSSAHSTALASAARPNVV